MITLNKKPIGLKINMSKEEMMYVILQKIKEWKKEGFASKDIVSSIFRKCNPLINGYYWKDDNARKILKEVLIELNIINK